MILGFQQRKEKVSECPHSRNPRVDAATGRHIFEWQIWSGFTCMGIYAIGEFNAKVVNFRAMKF